MATPKFKKLRAAKIYYLRHPEGITDAELADAVGVSLRVAGIYRVELNAVRVKVGKYTYVPTEEDRKFARLVGRTQRRIRAKKLKQIMDNSNLRRVMLSNRDLY